MFIEFTVSNFRSFKDSHTFSLLASKNKELVDENTFPANDKTRLLNSAVIYGANASGKSNFFLALSFFFKFTISSGPKLQIGDPIDTEPFLFAKQTKGEPSTFELIFFLNGIRYRYGLAVDTGMVQQEYLFAVMKVREVTLFTRVKQEIEINPTYFKEGQKIKEAVRENASFLSICAQLNGEIAKSIISYMQNYIVTSGLSSHGRNTSQKLLEKKGRDAVITFLSFADIQIKDIKTESVSMDFSGLGDKEIEELFKKKMAGAKEEKVYFSHTVYDGTEAVDTQFLDINDESAGTRKLFEYTGSILDTLERGTPLFIDEFDSRLHPLIIEGIIKLFNSPESNPNHAQLVVSCHAVNIMTNKLFRRDQIWFCEKDQYGATDLYSLVEYDEPVRSDASFSKSYLQGKYGAVPYLGEINRQTGCED
ncbi:MAG TPA: ATP-binding protein [Spirochaetota bacterium]|nr:ATP-binding protein [Spirochaetota bacterium]